MACLQKTAARGFIIQQKSSDEIKKIPCRTQKGTNGRLRKNITVRRFLQKEIEATDGDSQGTLPFSCQKKKKKKES